MKTNFDHITDAEIAAAQSAMSLTGLEPASFYERLGSDLEKIACAAYAMCRWGCWLGPPVTYYEDSGLKFDGHHRVRACKYVCRAYHVAIQIPLRYDHRFMAKEEVKQMSDADKEYRAPCSVDCLCSKPVPAVAGVGDSLCQ